MGDVKKEYLPEMHQVLCYRVLSTETFISSHKGNSKKIALLVFLLKGKLRHINFFFQECTWNISILTG